ncbi:hypothetical protein LJC15_01780, partial [Desulfovibrio sp. OttesenSCG-928-G11]|nr:hypothetical protein [Desulfovibrio sp. OttesenSCG-928-G11]
WEAIMAFCWTLIGILTGLYGGQFRDVEITNCAGWFMAFIGTIMLFICMRAIIRGDDKKSKVEYTDEDAAQGLKTLEMMYLKEHGALPDYPEKADVTANKDQERTEKE